ncbi:MAG TPA: glycosyltransferase family 1 protein [Candidatus Atribacteria bacterium]|nr:glycosyltransferase family 1 protein [Candidatus Atribacteria bacterium]
MKILLANKFFYLKGGSEYVFFEQAELLKKRGHKIIFFSMKHPKNFSSKYEEYFINQVDYEKGGIRTKISASFKLLYSFEAKRKIDELIRNEKPDIAHLHNIYHQISPSILHALKRYNIPIVLTLHDCKIVCASHLMLANGKVCEACKNGRYYNCFLKKCVKNSKVKSLLNTIEMYLHHKILHIYDLVDVFISPSRFLKDKLREMGFKKEIVYLPNFVNVDEFNPFYEWEEKSIVYFGRLSREKGLFTLIEAVKDLDVKLKIIGEGPIRESLELGVRSEGVGDDGVRSRELGVRSEGVGNVEFLGYKAGKDLKDEIRKSMFVVVPSECYENNPRSVIEAFALGKPVLGSNTGGIPELVKDKERGLLFEAGNKEDLRERIQYLLQNLQKVIEMGKDARKFVEEELNEERFYRRLMEIYLRLVESRK